MKPMVGYVRVSTGKQAESGLSLESQQEKIRAMATLKGVSLLDVVVDAAESARDLDRPGVQRILAMVKAREVSGVVVAKLDRLTRSVGDLSSLLKTFERKDVALISVAETLDTGTATGRMVINLMVSIAQWEREIISERTSDALRAKRARGERAGNVPYGYTADEGGALRENPDEQAVITMIRQHRKDGKSLREITDALNGLGLLTRRGTAWRFQYVASILGNGQGAKL